MAIQDLLIVSSALFGLIFLVLLVIAITRPEHKPRSETRRDSNDLMKIKDQINGDDEW